MMRYLCLLLLALCTVVVPARAAGPVETSPWAITGVAVDVTDTDASKAKTRAIVEAQVIAFRQLADRMAAPAVATELKKQSSQQIGRLLRSLSIEEEHTGPGRYIGKLTVRFLPKKTRDLFERYGVDAPAIQGPILLVVPVWNTLQGPVLWEANPWRTGWLNLHAEQGALPIIVPLGDADDTGLLSPDQAIRRDPAPLKRLMQRYGAQGVLVAIAAPQDDDSVRAVMTGESPLGKINFDKTYRAEEPVSIQASADLAAQRFYAVMLESWTAIARDMQAAAVARQQAEREAAQRAAASASNSGVITVSVPFSSPAQWADLRQRISTTPGIVSLNVGAMAASGAIVRLGLSTSVQNVAASLRNGNMRLDQVGGIWIIQGQ